MELNNWSGWDQLNIIDIWMKSRCLKVHQTTTLASQKSDIIVQYHAARRITEILYSAIRSDLKMTTGLWYVVSVHLLAKLWDNEFSWNHDRTYLLQVMVGFVLCVVQDTYINITYINDCTVTYIHVLHTPMGSCCIPRTAPPINEIYLPKHSWIFTAESLT